MNLRNVIDTTIELLLVMAGLVFFMWVTYVICGWVGLV